jgi:cytochrome c
MRKIFGILIVLSSAVAATCATAQEQHTTPDEAKALLQKAVAYYKSAGRETALKDFSDKQGKFIDRDLYVFCYGSEQKITAHGANATLIGKDLEIFKDADGKPFAVEMYKAAVASANGVAEYDYRWVSPTTKKIEAKSSTVEKVGNDVCGVGYYK